MSKTFSAVIFSLALSSTAAFAEAKIQTIRQAEKISIVLTGSPLTVELRAKVVKEEITLEALADQLSKSPDFVEHFAQFWIRLLGMQSPIDLYAQGGLDIGRNWLGSDATEEPQHNEAYMKRYVDDHKFHPAEPKRNPPELMITRCADAPLITWWNSANHVPAFTKAATQGQGYTGPIQAGTQPYWAELLQIAKETTATCEDTTTVTVKPWWDPEKVTTHASYINVPAYRIPPQLLERCGPALINCTIGYDRGYDRFIDEVDYDLSMEPGYLISHVVAEDLPFSDILTSPKTIMTGRYGYFMANMGKARWNDYPGKGIVDINHPIFAAPKVLDKKHYWINRGPLHAGVLTTPGFQIITNGRRAKANRTYETFLCKKFTVPDGAQADPSDSNPDLTKRAYCSYCHRSLEPMAAFFNKWPDTGITKYDYENDDPKVNDTGRFNGLQGKGAATFGKIVTETEGFDECSIKRAFEFVNGRRMNTVEAANKLGTHLATFRGSQKSLRAVLKAMVLSPEFLTPKEGQP